jgi:hypothetical protein
MARLYVVNCTGQNRVVNYRLDYATDDAGNIVRKGMVPYKSILIPARQQVPFGGDLHPLQIGEIVSQIEKHGAVHVGEIKTAKATGVVKMLWSQDKPVPRAILEDVVAHNMGRLTEQGAQRRRNLALAANAHLNQVMDVPLQRLDLEFEAAEQDADMPSPDLEEGLRIVNPAGAQPKRAGRRKY